MIGRSGRTPVSNKRTHPLQALSGASIAIVIVGGSLVVVAAIFDRSNPAYEGPPEFRAELAPTASSGEVLGFLADAVGEGDGIEWMRLKDDRLVVRFRAGAVVTTGCAVARSARDSGLFATRQTTLSPAACVR